MHDSYIAFGWWGVSSCMQVGLDFAAAVMGGTSGTAAVPSDEELHAGLSDKELHDRLVADLQNHLRRGYQPEMRERELYRIVRCALGPGALEEYNGVELVKMFKLDGDFHGIKRDLDVGLLQGTISHDEYASRVNSGWSEFLRELEDVMTAVHFEIICPDFQRENHQLVYREEMPEDYQTIGKLLRL